MQPPGTLVEKQRARVIIILQYITVWGGLLQQGKVGVQLKKPLHIMAFKKLRKLVRCWPTLYLCSLKHPSRVTVCACNYYTWGLA